MLRCCAAAARSALVLYIQGTKEAKPLGDRSLACHLPLAAVADPLQASRFSY